jgi:hypothetical protein
MNACHHPAVLVYPSKMLYPNVLPLVSMLDAFHAKANASQSECNKKRLKLFYIVFVGYVSHGVAVPHSPAS